MELDRINHGDLEYIIELEIYNTPIGVIPSPMFYITTKSSKKNRCEKISKYDGHFNFIKIDNPYKLYKKIFLIFDTALKNFDFVYIIPHFDDPNKRERLYLAALDLMGFEKIYSIYSNKQNHILLKRKGIKIKRKMIKQFYESILETCQ